MPRREMTADEADDHWTEHGDKTPQEVWLEERDHARDRGDGIEEEPEDAWHRQATTQRLTGAT